MVIKQFTQDGIDSLFCQHLTRYSLYSADLALQAEDEDGLQAIAFAWLPGDTNDAASWLRSQLPNMTGEEQQTLLTNERYLTRTDAQLQSRMLPNSAKLSFFISQKPGYGTPVLNALIERLRERGIEWLYLWTDCTCNWEYYPKHGFEQIGEGTVPEFSTDDEEYVYKMFCKENQVMKEWLFLIGAIVFETFATSMLKLSEQFTRPLPTIAMLAGYILSFYLLSHALRTVPIGIAYAIWSALGIVLITLIGIFVFKQVPDIPAYIGLALIMAGVIVINLFSKMEVH